MRLGLTVGYSGARVAFPIEMIKLADKLGYDSVWTIGGVRVRMR